MPRENRRSRGRKSKWCRKGASAEMVANKLHGNWQWVLAVFDNAVRSAGWLFLFYGNVTGNSRRAEKDCFYRRKFPTRSLAGEFSAENSRQHFRERKVAPDFPGATFGMERWSRKFPATFSGIINRDGNSCRDFWHEKLPPGFPGGTL